MIYFCKLSDKARRNKSKYNHLKSATHKTLDESIIRRFVVLNPIFEKIDGKLSRYFIIYIKTYERYLVGCVLKLLTTTSHVRYIKIDLDYFFNFSKNSILSRIIQDR